MTDLSKKLSDIRASAERDKEEWIRLKREAVDKGWPTTAFDYGHEPKSLEEALAWQHWDDAPAWKCNECGQEATDGVGQRDSFLAGWEAGHAAGRAEEKLDLLKELVLDGYFSCDARLRLEMLYKQARASKEKKDE